MIGLLVHGDNHFIVDGPKPDRVVAEALIRCWSIIRIGARQPPDLAEWNIVSKAFREDLKWAIIIPAATGIAPAVTELLDELAVRGVNPQ